MRERQSHSEHVALTATPTYTFARVFQAVPSCLQV